jgi:hypothetical protein
MNIDAPMSPTRVDRSLLLTNCRIPMPNKAMRRAYAAKKMLNRSLFGDPGESSSLTVFAM